jgi:DNA-directed RNA polymerase specialized sigma subunit
MKVVDIANEIFNELGEPSSISIPAITFWVRSNIGKLNNAINTEFSVNTATLEIQRKINKIETNIGIDESCILKKMYSVYYYDTQIRANVKGLETDAVVEVSSDGMRVRKTSKTEIIRYLTSLKRLELDELNKMINYYRIHKAVPRQVAGDDTKAGYYNGGYSSTGGMDYNRIDR